MSISVRREFADQSAALIPSLRDPAAAEPAVAGSKAANLAVAQQRGLPIIDGFVIPVEVAATIEARGDFTAVRTPWAVLSLDGARPLVVRSSAPDEDTTTSSRAGEYSSVVGVTGWDEFVDAFSQVMASAASQPMAVLVQLHLDPVLGGVLFGVDPVSGRSDRRVVAAVAGGPWDLVAGAVEGRRFELTPRGSVVESRGEGPRLNARVRRNLLGLERRAARLFGGPQDIEWAVDRRGRAWLLQSRPITVVGRRPSGPRLGPGPIAEVFPAPLSRLAADLWLPPLAEAIGEALVLTGAAGRREIDRSPVVVDVRGRVAVDLALVEGRRAGRLRAIDPRPGLRRLAASWRTGRLRTTFPRLADDILATLDRDLSAVPPLAELRDEDLLGILRSVGRYLVAVHGHEMLAAKFEPEPTGSTAAAHAIAALAGAREQGLSDAEIVNQHPVTLSLLAPDIGSGRPMFPELPSAHTAATPAPMPQREELRLRVRWLHELSARAALEVGRRLVRSGAIERPDHVASLTLDDVERAMRGDLLLAAPGARDRDEPPLPAVFRLADGAVIAEDEPPDQAGAGGVGAGGDRGRGRVVHEDPDDGDVLVVTTLDPALSTVLPKLAGLVAETGSPLSHLAILAREQGVATVVGFRGARATFAPGVTVVVDGRTGRVEALSPAERTEAR